MQAPIREKMTIDEFERIADAPNRDGYSLELIDGVSIEKTMPTQEHGTIADNFAHAFSPFVRIHHLGRTGIEVRFKSVDDPHNAFIPDVAFVLGSEPIVDRGSVRQMPDIAVEIASPDDNLRALREKARAYLAKGTRIVWLVLPAKHLIEVYTPDGESILTLDDVLDGGTVLPGFTLPVRTVFTDALTGALM